MRFLYFCDSTSVGRINREMLSEMQVMELFYTPIEHFDAHVHFKGDEDDPCTWAGLFCNDNHVSSIDWYELNVSLQGSLNFCMLPRQIEYVSIFGQRLIGDVDVGQLPETLEYFCIHSCQFTGTLDIEKLPRKMKYFITGENAITDIRNVRNLPESLEELNVQERGIQKDLLVIGPLPDGNARLNFKNTQIKEIRFENPADSERLILR